MTESKLDAFNVDLHLILHLLPVVVQATSCYQNPEMTRL